MGFIKNYIENFKKEDSKKIPIVKKLLKNNHITPEDAAILLNTGAITVNIKNEGWLYLYANEDKLFKKGDEQPNPKSRGTKTRKNHLL